ncbi:MAG: c-type cytochrome [Chloroflexi bacterium]|nr:c-type cytochrome [Chloroflexota bacterium]
MRQRGLLLAGLITLGLGVAGLALLSAGALGPRAALDEPAARGAWIFRTGTRPDGSPLPYSGGMMMRLSCADCHGPDGHGLRTPMFISPDITYRNLTDPAGMLEPDGSRGSTYTDGLIRRAVVQGVDAEGKPLAWPMPRWRLSEAEWRDLLAYLKALP